ncbi:MAG TPA: hypothetical protein DCX06_13670 [Opitutae bacterium]|nr:hypothetical protein [Opitutae bacterium]
MNVHLKIQSFETLDSIPDFWTLRDYHAILERCDIDDFAQMSFPEAEEMLFMALTDMEPDEAAKIILNYKLSDTLRAGQIEQMSHEMLEDCLPEEHPDISLHYCLFNINELLNRAFKNQFPEATATRIRFQLKVDGITQALPSKELILQAFALCFTEGQIITRLYEEQLAGQLAFPESESILWQLHAHKDHEYSILTSRYWIEREDFSTLAADGKIKLFKTVAEH